ARPGRAPPSVLCANAVPAPATLADAQTLGKTGRKRQRPRGSLLRAAVEWCLPRSSRGGGNGSSAWTRTKDPAVNSRLLYRLSYAGIGGESLAIGAGPSSLFREESHGGSGSGFRAYGRTGCRQRERSSATGGVENAARSSADHSLLEG